MSKVFNHYFFKREEVIQDIKDNAEDYSRPYSVQASFDRDWETSSLLKK